jgi:acyl dehydratase
MPESDPRAVRDYDAITVGEPLPSFTVVLTLQRLVMEAAANRDFAPWHIDREAARASGAPEVFANTTLVETLLEAGIRAWAGPSARIRVLDFALRSFNCVGDTVSTKGAVLAKRSGGLVDVDVWIESHRGRTVEGRAVLAFPTKSASSR